MNEVPAKSLSQGSVNRLCAMPVRSQNRVLRYEGARPVLREEEVNLSPPKEPRSMSDGSYAQEAVRIPVGHARQLEDVHARTLERSTDCEQLGSAERYAGLSLVCGGDGGHHRDLGCHSGS